MGRNDRDRGGLRDMGSARYQGGSKHLRFEKLPLKKGRKLNEYNVFNDQFNEFIGIIKWRGGWRQYVFSPLNHFKADIIKIEEKKYLPIDCIMDLDFSRSCNREINNFIDKLMEEWRKNLKKKKDTRR